MRSNKLHRLQAYQNRICRENIGLLLIFVLILTCFVGVIIVSIKDPFDSYRATRFLYCYLSCNLWTWVIGEIIAASAKAWVLWMANPKNFESREQGTYWQRLAKSILSNFPYILPTEL